MLSAILLLVFCVGWTSAQPQVEIDSGIVQGRRVSTHYDDPNKSTFVNSFYGIPYAEPPVGDLRFKEPEPVAPWEGVFEATTLGTACIQSPQGWLWLTHPGWSRYDEDCLNLNVFTPEDMNPDEPYAVMIYFYGGGYESGGNIQYPGHFMAARNVIVVVPNYRVGIFGFANTGDAEAPGNYGLYDQQLTMDWVQRNIAQFGGDPGKVTLYGQSAGASSSSLHIVSPKSRGLFHQIIGQSGTDLNFWTLNLPLSDPADYTRQVAEKVDCPSGDTAEMIECMRDVEQWLLRNNSGIECTPGHFCQGHAPVVDGPGGLIPDLPLNLRESGDFDQDVNIMSGYNSDDGSLYTVFMIPESMEGGFNRSRWQYHLRESLLFFWEPQFDEKTNEDLYQAFNFFYTPWPTLEDEELNRLVFNDLITDGAFGYASEKQLRLQSQTSDSNYMYLFGYRSNATLGQEDGFWNGTEWIGVPHSGELPYVFGWSLMQLAPQVRADTRILIDIMDYNDEDVQYADFVMDLWSNFAKYGNPTPEPIEAPIGNGPVQLAPFTDDERNIIKIGREVTTDVNYRVKESAFFVEYVSYIAEKILFAADEKVSPRKAFYSDELWDRTSDLVMEFLTQQYPLEYDHLFE